MAQADIRGRFADMAFLIAAIFYMHRSFRRLPQFPIAFAIPFKLPCQFAIKPTITRNRVGVFRVPALRKFATVKEPCKNCWLKVFASNARSHVGSFAVVTPIFTL